MCCKDVSCLRIRFSNWLIFCLRRTSVPKQECWGLVVWRYPLQMQELITAFASQKSTDLARNDSHTHIYHIHNYVIFSNQ